VKVRETRAYIRKVTMMSRLERAFSNGERGGYLSNSL